MNQIPNSSDILSLLGRGQLKGNLTMELGFLWAYIESPTPSCPPFLSAGNSNRAAALRRRAARPRVAEMAADLRVLAAELQRCYGTVGFLPTREDLRLANRWASEQAHNREYGRITSWTSQAH